MNMKGLMLLVLVVLVVGYATYRYAINDEMQGGTVVEEPAGN